MRFLLLVLGIALGVAGTLAYATFASPSQVPATAPLPADPQLTVTLGDRLVTEIIRRSVLDAPGLGTTKPDVAVTLRDDLIVVDASVDVLGKRASGTATLRPKLDGGRLRIDVVDTSLGTLPMPPLEQILEKQINARIAALLVGMPVTFTGARVDRTRGLTVTCRVDLAALDLGREVGWLSRPSLR
jgi:uncharacterized protein YpmS